MENLGVLLERVTPAAQFVKDLGADDLDEVEMRMALEDAFDIKIPDSHWSSIKTVKQMADYVRVSCRKAQRKH